MNDTIILISISKEELKELIREAVAEAINSQKVKGLLSFKEACKFLGISSSTLNKWKVEGKIPFKRLGKRIFFIPSEILTALKEDPYYSRMKKLMTII